MIKFTGESPDGKTLIGLGLSFKNLEKLRQGFPIEVDTAALNLPWNATILIFSGKDDATMRAEILPAVPHGATYHIEKPGDPSVSENYGPTYKRRKP